MRLALAISVAIWLAGGCLFGCANTAVASEANQAAVHHEGCHGRLKHVKPRTVSINLNETFAGVSSGPREGMNECPLMISTTAAVSKSSSHSPDLVSATAAAIPLPVSDGELARKQFVDPFLPNRGPTYLRCCVFLI